MNTEELPKFIKEGAFVWTKHGYHYGKSKPVLALDKSLSHIQNKWEKLAVIVEFAKKSDHSKAKLLVNWFDLDSSEAIGNLSFLIFGDIATCKDLDILSEVMRNGKDSSRLYACKAAVNACAFWLVPDMLNAWHSVQGLAAHETIGYAISDLLEERSSLEDMGPIALNAGKYDFFSKTDTHFHPKIDELGKKYGDSKASERFDSLVKTKFRDIQSTLGSDKLPVWGGKLYSVKSFVEQFHSLISNVDARSPLWDLVPPLREKFEAATGINCSCFYKENKFQQINAISIIEEFLGGKESDKYEEGVRYFFGHNIPEN